LKHFPLKGSLTLKNSKAICPYCGEEIDRSALACPYCGSDEQTGWSDKTYLDGIDISDMDDEAYNEMLHTEFGIRNKKQTDKKKLITIIIALILLVLFVIQIIPL
ncbi:MAG: zinc ribbon domain-containing protein, partial [Fibrobacter sp.]|nr:zinc ribbon domain-containing protein [Fibrobacter sp.]